MDNFDLRKYITENKINENFFRIVPLETRRKIMGQPTLDSIPRKGFIFPRFLNDQDKKILQNYSTKIAKSVVNRMSRKELTMDLLKEPYTGDIEDSKFLKKIFNVIRIYLDKNKDLSDIIFKYKDDNRQKVLNYLIDFTAAKIKDVVTAEFKKPVSRGKVDDPNSIFAYRGLNFKRDMYKGYGAEKQTVPTDAQMRDFERRKSQYQTKRGNRDDVKNPRIDSGILYGRTAKEIEDFANETLDYVAENFPPGDWYNERNLTKIISNYVNKHKSKTNEITKPETWLVAGYPLATKGRDAIRQYVKDPRLGTIYNNKGELIQSEYAADIIKKNTELFEDLIELKMEEALDNLDKMALK